MRGWWTTFSSLRAAGTNRNTTWKRGKEHLVWQAGRLETYQNTIIGLFLAIMKKNGKSFGRLQALASGRNYDLVGVCYPKYLQPCDNWES
jgi:hypothetical protein